MVRKWINASDRFEILHEEFDVSKGLPEPIVGRCDLVFKDKLTNVERAVGKGYVFKRGDQLVQYLNSLTPKIP